MFRDDRGAETHGHDVDTAQLLSDHDCPSGDIGSPQSGDCKDIPKPGKVIGALERVFLLQDLTVGVKLLISLIPQTKEGEL